MRKVGLFLISLGLIAASIPFIGNTYMQFKRNTLYSQYLAQLKDKEEKQQKIYPSAHEGTNHQEEVNPNYSFKEDEVIGRIKIASIDLDILLLEGESKKNLKLGATHMLGTAYPGQKGNCVIAGHRNYTFGSMFNRLGEVKLEDKITVEVEENTYHYEVTDIKIIEPTQLEVLQQPKEERELTLLTCHPIHVGNKRLVIKARWIPDMS